LPDVFAGISGADSAGVGVFTAGNGFLPRAASAFLHERE
jgi:hypothetical protein